MNLEEIKHRSESYLRNQGFEPNGNLPTIDSLDQVSPRNATDVASRMFAMSNLIGMGYGAKRRKIKKALKAFNLWEFVTELERKDLKSLRINEERKIHYQWLCECCQALAWTLNLVEMNHFERCKPDLSDKIPPIEDPTDRIKRVKLKPIHEIQAQVDLLYRLQWHARFKGRHKNAKNINYNVIAERRRAIDWVYGVKANWDEISLDT